MNSQGNLSITSIKFDENLIDYIKNKFLDTQILWYTIPYDVVDVKIFGSGIPRMVYTDGKYIKKASYENFTLNHSEFSVGIDDLYMMSHAELIPEIITADIYNKVQRMINGFKQFGNITQAYIRCSGINKYQMNETFQTIFSYRIGGYAQIEGGIYK